MYIKIHNLLYACTILLIIKWLIQDVPNAAVGKEVFVCPLVSARKLVKSSELHVYAKVLIHVKRRNVYALRTNWNANQGYVGIVLKEVIKKRRIIVVMIRFCGENIGKQQLEYLIFQGRDWAHLQARSIRKTIQLLSIVDST